MRPYVRSIGNSRTQVGESPVWDASQRLLYWVDVWSRRIFQWKGAAAMEEHLEFDEMVGAIALCRDGRLLALMESAAFMVDFSARRAARLSSPPNLPPTHRFNDAIVDGQGRLIAGSMRKSQLGAEPTGTLYSYDGESWRVLLEGFWTVNGLAFSPDARTLYVSDSHPSMRKIWACEYDADTGCLGERRLFVDMQDYLGRPDGAAVDVEGCYWVAGVGGGCLYRFAPDGSLVTTLSLPVENPTKVAFGGDALGTLYVTSMSIRTSHSDPLAGALLELTAPVIGHPPGCFRIPIL